MNPNYWQRIQEVYHSALECRPEEVDDFVRASCGDDEEMHREVLALLKLDEKPRSFLPQGALEAAAPLAALPDVSLIGMKLGQYEVTSFIGSGGMGVVYRARDSKLKRDVAIKVLPSDSRQHADRESRFRREAEVLAALNHPNIAAVYDLGDARGRTFIVQEFVDGENLADRLRRGSIPLNEALNFAEEIAGALEAAHDKGIVHRDLKPANIKITPEGKVKVLDFGLAKIERPLTEYADSEETAVTTGSGVIMGTIAYMSPERARGQDADRRSDVWAFGCVLFEMLSGKRPFTGDTTTDILSAIVQSDPDWKALPQTVSPLVVSLVRKCLQKDRRHRLQSIADARIDIEQSGGEVPPPRTLHAHSTVWWRYVVGGLLLLISISVVIALGTRPRANLQMMRFEMNTPGTTDPASFAISPDGQFLVFSASSSVVDKPSLWLRNIVGSTTARPIPGTEGAIRPFWSPDSASIGFFADAKLKTIDRNTGVVRVLAAAESPCGGAWNTNDVILFTPTTTSPVLRIAAAGGAASPATTQTPRRTGGQRFPEFLPDQRHFLYFDYYNEDFNQSGLFVGSLDGGEPKRLGYSQSKAIYSPSGFLMFLGHQDELLAQKFDLRSLALSGNAVPIAENISTGTSRGTGSAAFSLSSSGTLAYRTFSTERSRLSWRDRSGAELGTVGEPGLIAANPELSPDDKTVAVDHSGDIWTLDTTRALLSRFTFGPFDNHMAMWSPRGDWIAYASRRTADGTTDIYRKALNAPVSNEVLAETGSYEAPLDWSSDGKFLIYHYGREAGIKNVDLWYLPIDDKGKGKARPYLDSPFTELMGELSPNVRWFAYQSNESGESYEIYIQAFPEPGTKFHVSTNGGVQPRWSKDGKELFFIANDERMMAAAVRESADGRSLIIDEPKALFPTGILGGIAPFPYRKQQYDVARDGRFLVDMRVSDTTPITVVLNWRDEKPK